MPTHTAAEAVPNRKASPAGALGGARDEFHLAAIVQDLKTLANYIWRPLLNIPVACVA